MRLGQGLALSSDLSFNEIAAMIGIQPSILQVGDVLPNELATAQLYWPNTGPHKAIESAEDRTLCGPQADTDHPLFLADRSVCD